VRRPNAVWAYHPAMYVNQSIQRPNGITVFGSCLVRVDPDFASIRFACTRTLGQPAEAFTAARGAARAVRERLALLGIPARDVRESDVSLAQAYDGGYNQARKMIGYCATVSFHVIVADLVEVEPVLVGVVDAGADIISSVHMKTKRLREVRSEARAEALRSARKKAEDYASAGGVRLGVILHVEDVNPDDISRRSHAPDVDLSSHDEAATPGEPQNPGSIVVAGAVMACFAIVPAQS
jgi:uncharacterized protein YggE